MKIRNETDFWSGVMFIAFGLFFGAFATRYDFGTARVMGPAYFPTILGGLLALVGVLMTLAGLGRAGEGGKLERLISSFASHEFRWKEVIILSIVMAVITYLVFIIGLKLTIPVLPAFLNN